MNDTRINTHTLFFIYAAAGALNQKLYQLIELQNQQIRVLKKLLGKMPRPNMFDKRLIAQLAHTIDRRILDLSEHIVTVDSLRRWYREMIAATYTAKKRGRPPLSKEHITLILRLADENPTWGENTIADRLRELGHNVSDRAVGNALRKFGRPPAPDRSRLNDWLSFIKNNFSHLIAIDCATWEVPSHGGKRTVRHHAFYAMRLGTREVRLLGVTDRANGAWITQCIRTLTSDTDDPFMHGVTHVILDNDPMYVQPMRTCFTSNNCKLHFIKPQAPWMNAYIERFIGTTRRDLRNQFIPLSTELLTKVLQQHVIYYNTERTHQRIAGHRMPTPVRDRFSSTDGLVKKRAYAGNMLNAYYREVV